MAASGGFTLALKHLLEKVNVSGPEVGDSDPSAFLFFQRDGDVSGQVSRETAVNTHTYAMGFVSLLPPRPTENEIAALREVREAIWTDLCNLQ